MDIVKKLKTGAFWVLLFSIIGGPLAILRNWLLKFYNPEGDLLADYVVIMIFFNFITTMLIFGGSSVLTNFIPKIGDNNKFKFLISNVCISIILFIIFSLIVIFFPNLIFSITNSTVNSSKNLYLLLLPIPVLFSQLIIYYLQGEQLFKISSFLSQIPNILITIFGLVLVLSKIANLKIAYIEYVFLIFISILILSCIIIIVIGGRLILQQSEIKLEYFLPKDFWKFSIFIHLMTISTFLYQNFDQIYILKKLGSVDLGVYFILIQLVEAIRFVPIRLGQVLLSSFSSLVTTEDFNSLKSVYNSLCDTISVFNLLLSGILIIFIPIIFSFYYIDLRYALPFTVLILAYNFAAIGNVNTMLILSKNKSISVFVINLIMISIIIFGLTSLENVSFFNIILIKSFAILISQLGFFLTIYFSINRSLLNLRRFLECQVILILLVILINLIGLGVNIYIQLILALAFIVTITLMYKAIISKIIKNLRK